MPLNRGLKNTVLSCWGEGCLTAPAQLLARECYCGHVPLSGGASQHRAGQWFDYAAAGSGFGEIAAVAGVPLVPLLDEDRAGQPQQRGRVRKYAHDVGAAFDEDAASNPYVEAMAGLDDGALSDARLVGYWSGEMATRALSPGWC